MRPLAEHEFKLRGKIKEKAYELANIIEERWKQHSRCNWLKQGYKNTRFFHAFASSRLSGNKVLSLEHQGQRVEDPKLITGMFLEQLRGLLGTSKETMAFDPWTLYQIDPSLASLQDPFTIQEVESSGPDRIPNEFLHTYWPSLKEEIMNVVQGFYQNQLNLEEINKANVVMISKIKSPATVNEFWPISVINLLPKLLSKILANRLRSRLLDLISTNQTAFIHDRQITKNFVATRETLQYISASKKQAVFLKIDFAKAFDSIEWDFLFKVMAARGFPPRWLNWIKVLLTTASSRVLING